MRDLTMSRIVYLRVKRGSKKRLDGGKEVSSGELSCGDFTHESSHALLLLQLHENNSISMITIQCTGYAGFTA